MKPRCTRGRGTGQAAFARRHALWLALAITLGAFWSPMTARAHEMRPAVLALAQMPESSERPPGDGLPAPELYTFRWSPPRGGSSGDALIHPFFPPHCKVGPKRLDCGEAGLRGTLGFAGLAGSNVEVIVQLRLADGSVRTEVLDGRRPELLLDAGEHGVLAGATAQLAWVYTTIGIEHILTGFDHLLFVLGLVLMIAFGRPLLSTITAFTVAHSITLASSVMGLIAMPSAPVEVIIALSILLAATEATHTRPTLARRYPWMVAFIFGLIHGFGFSGALQEIGLPPGQAPLALLCFNLGVEIGQLGVIALLFAIHMALQRGLAAGLLHQDALTRGRVTLIYAMGGVAAFWTIERMVGMVGG